MKKLILGAFLLASLFSCNNQEQQNSSDETSGDNGSSVSEQPMDAGLIEQGDGSGSAPGRNPEPMFAFSEEEWDFGTINDGEVVSHTFKFANTGGAPLVISDVTTTCGCTVPKWPKDPVEPGKTGEIQVSFDSRGKTGMVTKDINIIANTNPVQKIVRIKAQVLENK